jgi:hypothetical protein
MVIKVTNFQTIRLLEKTGTCIDGKGGAGMEENHITSVMNT